MTILVLAAVVAGGALATYLWDEDRMPLLARLGAGAALGLAVWGLVGFGLFLALGLSATVVALATAVTATPLALLASRRRRLQAVADGVAAVAGIRAHPWQALSLAATAIVLLVVFAGALYCGPHGIRTSDRHNLGDLPLHIGIASGFLYGENRPAEHPELSGTRLTYPFLADFVAAMLMRTGASLRTAFLAQNGLLALALLSVLHHWAIRLTRDRGAALLVPLLVLLNGGLGWVMFLRDAVLSGRGLLGELAHLGHDFTILDYGEPESAFGALRWGNSITTLLLPQRAFLFGLPLALLAWTLVWGAVDRNADASPARPNSRLRLLTAAGFVSGLLPLVHTHSFAVVLGAAAVWALLFRDRRAWARFFVTAAVSAAPSLLWLFSGSGMAARSFLGWQTGWDHGADNVVRFWLYNTGLVIPALVVALLWRGRAPILSRELGLLLLPFAGLFVVPNLVRLTPWIWDNVKFLFYWYVAATVPIALLLVRLWRRPSFWLKAAALLLGLSLTAAGALDVWRVASRQASQRIFDAPGMAFAALVMSATPPRAVILGAPTFNHPILLSGRRYYLGHAGHLRSQGLDAGSRAQDVENLYLGVPGALERVRSAGVEYVVVGPIERSTFAVDADALAELPLVGEAGAYRLYRLPQK